MRKRVVIVGGGVSGLIASYVFSGIPGVETRVFEEKTTGGEFLAGGLKYIHHTEAMVDMFDELGLCHSNFMVNGGILLSDVVQPYPKCFQDMEPERAARIQDDHWRKTRRSEPGSDSKKAMNDPASTKPRQALRCDFVDMINELSDCAAITNAAVVEINQNDLLTSQKERVLFDFAVVTLPLWVIRELVKWYVPHGMAMALNVAKVNVRGDRFARWDYVYTPYTPSNCVHRFSPVAGGYSVETNGELNLGEIESDLNFLWPEGWAMMELKEGLKGHLLSLDTKPDWPRNIAPIGRFAKWDSRATIDVALEDSIALAKRWLG